MACVETVCHKRQNITSNTVLNMFLWLVLNHKNFEHHHMHDCAKKLAKTEAVKNLCDCLSKCVVAFRNILCSFKERAAASESKCATAFKNYAHLINILKD